MVTASATRKPDAVEDFVEIIRTQIERQGLTQKQVADLAGIDYPAISNILGGKREPSLSTAAKIAGAVGLRLTLAVK